MNKKAHFSNKLKRITPAKDGHEKLHSTVQHELLHFKHPKMWEKNIRKLEKKTVAHMSQKRKKELLSKLR